MIRRRSQRGEGNVGCVLWVVVLILVAMVLWEVIPAKIATSRLKDFMQEQGKFAEKATAEQLKKRVLDKARELDLPVTAKQVITTRTGDRVKMRVVYTMPLEFPFYTYEWKVDLIVAQTIYYL